MATTYRGGKPPHNLKGMIDMTKYYRTVDGKPVEITEQEAKEQEKKNNDLFNSGDFSKMFDIEVILKIKK